MTLKSGFCNSIASAAVVVALFLTADADIRFLATARDTDTRSLAAPIVEGLPGAIVKESYTDSSSRGHLVSALGLDPSVVSCHCYVVISSYMEDRYRREPKRYAAEVAVYDQIRREGSIIDVVVPSIPLSYRWDLLPQWGAGHLPMRHLVVGPKITIIKLP